MFASICQRCGTSPRLWGDSDDGHRVKYNSRYIPTLVGRFCAAILYDSVNAVHPHACGEIGVRIVKSCIFCGTSPRLWGDCPVLDKLDHLVRYIPTLVGRFPGE